jgi:hypothetical protein
LDLGVFRILAMDDRVVITRGDFHFY